MRRALEGSQAIARAVALCRPQVVAAYPITPQTHIVEGIAKLVADGEMACELVSVESEFSAASVTLGAVAAGSRAFTASASQGILLMSEVLYDIAGLRLPAVMICANRAVSGPLSIWNDQQDSMAVRDAGWIQLYCADNQQGVDTLIQAYRIAERSELPVMDCVDGFTLTHTLVPIDLPGQADVDAFLPPYRFARTLDPHHPISVGTLVDPGYFTESRHSQHAAMVKAMAEIESAHDDWRAASGRGDGALLQHYGDPEARVGILAIGAVVDTLRAGIEDGLAGEPVHLIGLRCYRPFPVEALQQACAGLDTLVVLERALSPGGGGIIGVEVRAALAELECPPRVHALAAGLGGRDIPVDTLNRLLEVAGRPAATRFEILDVELDRLAPEDR